MVNPDFEDYMGDSAYLAPQQGMLRFVERDGKKLLQRYEWSYQLKKHDWFDVPLFEGPE